MILFQLWWFGKLKELYLFYCLIINNWIWFSIHSSYLRKWFWTSYTILSTIINQKFHQHFKNIFSIISSSNLLPFISSIFVFAWNFSGQKRSAINDKEMFIFSLVYSDTIIKFLDVVKALKYDDIPSYNKLRDLLKAGLKREGQTNEWRIDFVCNTKTAKVRGDIQSITFLIIFKRNKIFHMQELLWIFFFKTSNTHSVFVWTFSTNKQEVQIFILHR